MTFQKFIQTGIIGTSIWLISAKYLYAIPSPELVIGSAASVGQLLALLGATLGGGAAAFRMRNGKNGLNQKAQKRFMIALLVCATLLIVAVAGNIYQFNSQKNARLAQLQKTLNRPAISQGTQINDPTLKETSLFAQTQSLNGIDGASLETLMETGQSPLLIDVRENAESSMGTIPGASHIRFPDIDLNDPVFREQPVVLFCHNGNRSSEVCANLAALGIDCRFVVGGLEKWIVEGRSFSDPAVRGLADLRAIPEYSGKEVLFDTSEIESLVANDDVQFLDVRYPKEFALGHLPGAINIPLRAMPTAELTEAILALPTDKPLISACYDRRGCFISQVLGYEISKTGQDFMGRYTVPWEYFIPKTVKPHIEAWLLEQNKTMWARAIEAIASLLRTIADRTNFLVAIVCLAIVTRLAILPVALKSDRDQLVLRRHKSTVSDIKKQHKSDPIARSTATKAFYKKHGLTPGRNMLALVFLPITMLGISAVSMASEGYVAIGFSNLGSKDASFITPILATAFACLYFQLTLGGTRRAAIIIWALVMPLIGYLFLALSVAANIYVLFALALLFVQRAFVLGAVQKIMAPTLHRIKSAFFTHTNDGVIPLSHPELLKNCGNKAYHLAKMRKIKLPVPNGVVLSDNIAANYENLPDQQKKKISQRIVKRLGKGPFAVRSSGSAEDGMNNSFAGVFDSITDVEPAGLNDALSAVSNSFGTDAARSYGEGGKSNILIQPMVGGEISGVLFTRDPEHASAMLIEYVKGAGEGLVSGRLTPDIFRYGRKSNLPLGTKSAIDFAPLINLGLKIERLFGRPQDIEWTFSEGNFSIVQSRDITVQPDMAADPVRQEWERIINLANPISKTTDQVIFKQDEMAEVLPTPLPLSLAIMQRLWRPGNSVNIACHRLGLNYRPSRDDSSHLTTLMGRLYSIENLKAKTAVKMTRRAQRSLDRDPLAVHRAHFEKFLQPFEKKVSMLATIDFSKMPKHALLDQIFEMIAEFTTDVHSEIETINIAAQYFTDRALENCSAQGYDANDALGGANASPFAPFFKQQGHLNSHSDRPLFALKFGHRATFDYEISYPRYDENSEDLDAAFLLAISGKEVFAQQEKHTLPDLRNTIDYAVRYQSLKETAKHRSLLYFSQIRRAIKCFDEKLGFNDGCFYLTPNELSQTLFDRKKCSNFQFDVARNERLC